ncbi:phosphoglucosamine mutase, partial [Candidatus Aminicenantes bacterium AC-708-I09]|nr:phosphoglucosamine mutase [Candidatus Aminicenantes bacterium AC-708-I09]
AGDFPLDKSTVFLVGKALAFILFKKTGKKPSILIGRDTRESGEWIEQALIAGILSEKGEIHSAGIIPTSAIAYLTARFNYNAGIVISASHNPYYDNGIKIFSSNGTKISSHMEEEIENYIIKKNKSINKFSEFKKQVKIEKELCDTYIKFLKSQFPRISPNKNIKLVVDCGNGASSFIAPQIFSELGFDVIPINNKPDGKNINLNCGSLYPELLAQEVVKNSANLGIAYDGDTDRAIWVDEKGRILNGDYTLYVMANFLNKRGKLTSPEIIATVMSNLGLEIALKREGLNLIRTRVGDKYVLEEMIKRGSNLGGEQSGHTIFLDVFPTGDGILTTLKMLEVLITEEKDLSELVKDMEEFPQILLNVKIKEKKDLNQFPEIIKTINEVKKKLGNEGRVIVRFSGTEPKVRIMVEGKDPIVIKEYANQIGEKIEKYLG